LPRARIRRQRRAPALARADVGFAIGTGTDVAIETTDLTLMAGSLGGVVTAITLSRATIRYIRQNLVLAFGDNAAGIPIAAAVLYPFTGWLLGPMVAAAAMALSSLSVLSNANRLRRFTAKPVSTPMRTGDRFVDGDLTGAAGRGHSASSSHPSASGPDSPSARHALPRIR
jgi:hypothetical protein